MKPTSKTIYFILLMVCSTLSLGMQRMVQTGATKTSPSLYNRMQQKFTELKKVGLKVWNNFTTRYSKAHVIALPSVELHLQRVAQPVTTALDQAAVKTSHDIDQEIKQVIKAIELNKENLPEKKEIGLMVCTPPGIEIDFISALQSFDAIKNFITTEKIRILTKAGLSRQEINDILLQLENDQKYIYKNAYTIPHEPVFHDTTLDPTILQEIIIKLKKAGINPLCINIVNKPKKEMGNAFAFAKTPFRVEKRWYMRPTLTFSQELINNRPRDFVAFVIGHEIGHLILCHSNFLYWTRDCLLEMLRKKNGLSQFEEEKVVGAGDQIIGIDRDPLSIEIEKRVKRVSEEITTLCELEADITYSLYDKNTAETSLTSMQAIISSGRHDTATMRSDIHQSINIRYHWLKRIQDLHTEQDAKE